MLALRFWTTTAVAFTNTSILAVLADHPSRTQPLGAALSEMLHPLFTFGPHTNPISGKEKDVFTKHGEHVLGEDANVVSSCVIYKELMVHGFSFTKTPCRSSPRWSNICMCALFSINSQQLNHWASDRNHPFSSRFDGAKRIPLCAKSCEDGASILLPDSAPKLYIKINRI